MMRVVCAYCRAEMTPGPSAPVSHGICPTCLAAQLASLDRQPSPQGDGDPGPVLTHYIPLGDGGRRQRAACGLYVDARAHVVTPTCPTCRHWLETCEADDRETARALEAEFPESKGRLIVDGDA